MSIQQFSFPTAIHFGAGARHQVGAHLKSVGSRKPLIVTDRGVAGLPIAEEFIAGFASSGLQPVVFSDFAGNPRASHVASGAGVYRSKGADSVVGFGGGAALDVAKAIALLAVHEGGILEYAWDHPERRPLTHPLPHFVAVPTTSGTGSEVGRSAVISDDSTHVKQIIFSPALLARAVFADPELTYDLPAPITAATGIDALTHNIESYLSPVYHPLCDGIALEGARIAGRALPVAVKDGRNEAARADMMMSSLMGAVAFQKDLGAVHSCAHALSAILDLHHGLANGVMIDHVMKFNLGAADAKMSELARVTGAGTTAVDFVNWLTRLKADIGIPPNFRQFGVKSAHIGPLVEVALRDPCHKTNPRPCSRRDFEQMFESAF